MRYSRPGVYLGNRHLCVCARGGWEGSKTTPYLCRRSDENDGSWYCSRGSEAACETAYRRAKQRGIRRIYAVTSTYSIMLLHCCNANEPGQQHASSVSGFGKSQESQSINTCVFQKYTNFKSSQQYRTSRIDLSTSNSRELVKPFARYAYKYAVHNGRFTAFRLSDDDTAGGILAKHVECSSHRYDYSGNPGVP